MNIIPWLKNPRKFFTASRSGNKNRNSSQENSEESKESKPGIKILGYRISW